MQRQTLQTGYDRGVVQDVPRYLLPAGAVWNLTDYLTSLEGAPLQKRGGWKAGSALAGATRLNAVAYSPFSGSDKYCLIDDRGHLWFSGVSYSAEVLAQNPSLYWRLGESVGATTVQDSTTNNRDGSCAGVTLGEPGAITGDTDTAALFASPSSITTVYTPFPSGSKRTFIGWAERDTSAGSDTLFEGDGFVTGVGSIAPSLYIAGGGEDVTFRPNAAAGGSATWAAAWPGTGSYVFWTLTYDDSTKTAELFINGVSQGTKILANGYSASGGRFVLGSDFDGKMDEVAIFESILTAAQITAIHNAASGAITDMGAAVTTKQRPVFFNGKLIILPDGVTFTTPKKFDGTTISTLAMTGLTGVTPLWGVTYKSRLVIADTSTLYFSNALDPETYDVDSFVKATDPIVGIAALSNMIAIFSSGKSERLRGTTPPSSTTDGDMTLEPMFPEGCIDARSLVVFNSQMIWANLNGVHISDGASIANLVELGGIKQYWDSLMQSYVSGWVLAGGIIKGRYVLSITDASGGFVAALLCNLASKTWTFLSNVPAAMFSESQGAVAELLMATSNHNYVGFFASCFDPASRSSDGDGTAVQPSIEFPFFRGGTGSSRWRDLFLGVDLELGAGQTADLELWYTTTPDSSDYTQLVDDSGSPITIGGTSGYEVQRIPVGIAANGLGLKIVQVGASNKTELFDLEAIIRDREGRF